MKWFWKKADGRAGFSRVGRTRRQPAPEFLERRELLAAGHLEGLTEDRWWYATPITFSIAPDGMTWDRKPNALNAAFSARIAPGTWQREIARALQTWAAVADLDFVRVADSGLRFDALGKPQGDPRFGDIRFGGYDFGNRTELAHAYTPPPNGSTAAGDVAVNTAMAYNVGSQYDLYSVLLHETGHSLGLEHTASPTAVMGASYGGMRAGLEADDIAGIRAIYGARADDVYGQQGRGVGPSDSVDVSAGQGLALVFALGDLALTSIGDSDYFSVVAPTSGARLQATAIAAGVSLLSAQVSVYDASGSLLDTGGDASDYGLDVTASVAGVVAGQRYYIKVSGATGDVFSVGTYGLRVGFEGGQSLGNPSPPITDAATPPEIAPLFAPPVSPLAAPPETPPAAPPTIPPAVPPETSPTAPSDNALFIPPDTPPVAPAYTPPYIQLGSSGIPGGYVGTTSRGVQSVVIGIVPWPHARTSPENARSPTVVNIQNLIDDLKCFETVRDLRWPQGVTCPHCDSARITKQGHDTAQPERQRYRCQACEKLFDDLTATIFAGHHQPLRVWILCLYFMGLNLSNEQIGHELDLDPDDAQTMTTKLREGIVERKPVETLSGEVECDEVYVVAGHKGRPEAVKKKGGPPDDAG